MEVRDTWRRRAWCALMLLALVGCGGGGSPQVIVPESGAGNAPFVRATTLMVAAEVSASDDAAVRSADIYFDNIPPGGVYFTIRYRVSGGIASVSYEHFDPNGTRIHLTFKTGAELPAGRYEEEISVEVCLERPCVRQIGGSPLTIPTRLDIAADPPGFGVLAVASRERLTHNVVDAAYSAALDAVIMVSSDPVSAVYIHSLSTGDVRQLPLDRTPRSLSIGPTGTQAAVGHDGRVTLLDLMATTPAQSLDAALPVDELVLDGHSRVHAFSAQGSVYGVLTIDFAALTSRAGEGWFYPGTRARLHPDGDRLYTANNGLSPSDIANVDIASGTARLVRDSPYHGEYAMCGDLWFSADASTIVTACGNTFRASTDPALDMRYGGRLALGGTSDWDFRIGSLAPLPNSPEVMTIDFPTRECIGVVMTDACVHRVSTFSLATMQASSRLRLPAIVDSGQSLAQRGLFVFVRADGERVLISHTPSAPVPGRGYYLSRWR